MPFSNFFKKSVFYATLSQTGRRICVIIITEIRNTAKKADLLNQIHNLMRGEKIMDNTTITRTVTDGIPVELQGIQMEDEEIRLYISRGQKAHGRIEGLTIIADGEYVELQYKLPTARFDRIRRITGYLVGTLDRFNNGKRAEVMDRVTHSCSCCN